MVADGYVDFNRVKLHGEGCVQTASRAWNVVLLFTSFDTHACVICSPSGITATPSKAAYEHHIRSQVGAAQRIAFIWNAYVIINPAKVLLSPS
jgi:hypothetical protein